MIKSMISRMDMLIKNISLLGLVTLLGLSFYSCEDDALLAPQEEEECTGSYCNLSMPNTSNYIASFNPKAF